MDGPPAEECVDGPPAEECVDGPPAGTEVDGPPAGEDGAVNDSALCPLGESTSAEATPTSFGHQATNQPFPEVAWTREPSLRTSVIPDTPEASWPSTSVYVSPLPEYRARWETVISGMEGVALSLDFPCKTDTLPPPEPRPAPEPEAEPPAEARTAVEAYPCPLPSFAALTVVNEGPVKQVA